jgi:hypothetical protein
MGLVKIISSRDTSKKSNIWNQSGSENAAAITATRAPPANQMLVSPRVPTSMAMATIRTTSQIIINSLIRIYSFLVVLPVYYKTEVGAMNFFEI